MVSSTAQLSYVEKLKDPRWQRKRLLILNRDQWKCQKCDRGDRTLHVHHRLYEPDKEPWDVDDSHLATLCDWCHCSERDWSDSLQTLEFACRVRLWDQETFQLACSIGLMEPEPIAQTDRMQFLFLIDFLAHHPLIRKDMVDFVCSHNKSFATKVQTMNPYSSYP